MGAAHRELATLLVSFHREVLGPQVAVRDVVRVKEEARRQRVVRLLDRLLAHEFCAGGPRRVECEARLRQQRAKPCRRSQGGAEEQARGAVRSVKASWMCALVCCALAAWTRPRRARTGSIWGGSSLLGAALKRPYGMAATAWPVERLLPTSRFISSFGCSRSRSSVRMFAQHLPARVKAHWSARHLQADSIGGAHHSWRSRRCRTAWLVTPPSRYSIGRLGPAGGGGRRSYYAFLRNGTYFALSSVLQQLRYYTWPAPGRHPAPR